LDFWFVDCWIFGLEIGGYTAIINPSIRKSNNPTIENPEIVNP
jgi:hypothetical protein